MYRYLGMHICMSVGACECVDVQTVWPCASLTVCLWGVKVDIRHLSQLLSTLFIKAESPPEPGASQLTSGIPFHASESWNYRQPLYLWSFLVMSGDLNLGPHACKMSTVSTEPSLQPALSHFKTTRWTVLSAATSYFLTLPFLKQGVTCKAWVSEGTSQHCSEHESCIWDPCQ